MIQKISLEYKQENNNMNPYQLISVSLKLGLQACQVIKFSYMNKSIKHFFKAVDDPVTQADYKIQSMLIKGFKLNFPNLKIIGEEEKQYEGNVQTNYSQLSSIDLPEKIKFSLDYDLSKSCLWIDPIDNTKGFIEGQPEAVTTLIGLSYGNKSELGIVCIPFKKQNKKIIYNPSLLVGSVTGRFAYQYFPLEKRWRELNNQKMQNTKIKIAMSNRRENKLEKVIAAKVNGQEILAGGSGYKMALVALKQAHLMAYTLSYTQKWDTCAGEAVIKGMGGYCTTDVGEDITYDPSNPKQYNEKGVICTLDQDLLQKSVQICKELQGK